MFQVFQEIKGIKNTLKQEHDIMKKIQQVCLGKEEADPQKSNQIKLNQTRQNGCFDSPPELVI